MDQEEQRAHEPKERSAQVARVKEKTAQVKERTRPWKETIALILAIGAAQVSLHAATIFRGLVPAGFATQAVRAALNIVFFGLATVALFGISAKTRAFFEPRIGSAHAAVIRYALLLVGLVVILIITLHLFAVAVRGLLLGTALTSVLIGIAAQQSLSNVFAGMVLLLSRPFQVGDPIQLRAGALGGQLQGVVTEIGITYIRLDTGDTVLNERAELPGAGRGGRPHPPARRQTRSPARPRG